MLKNCRAIAAAWLLACGFFSGIATASETKVFPDSPYVRDVWETADKLPDDTVVSVIQARDGYLWVGTLHGLARFDGLNFTSFDDKDLARSRILYLFEDSRTNLWVGTDNNGVWLFARSGAVNHFLVEGGRLLDAASEENNGTIWLRFVKGTEARIARYWNGNLQPVGTFHFAVAEKNGPVWLGSDAGLIPIISAAGSGAMVLQQASPVPVNDLRFMLASKTGGVWRFVGGRVQKWKDNRLERDLGPYPWKDQQGNDRQVMAACEDDHGNLIVGTYGDGVYWFDENGKYNHILNELTHAYILSLTFDNEGNLWVGTNGRGLNRVRRNAFGVLSDLVVQSVSTDKNGDIWVGYNGNRVDHWIGGKPSVFNLVSPEQSDLAYAKSVFVDNSGQVFAGIFFQSAGARLFRFEQNRFVPVELEMGGNISAIHQDRSGRIWLGTDAGLVLFNGRESKLYSVAEGLPAADVRAIADDPEGNLWVGTSAGLACLRDGKITSLHKKDGLPSEDVSALLADGDGALWVGTRGSGLGRLATNHWTYYTAHEGLGGDSIGYLVEENKTNLWIGSNSGLMRVSKKSLNEFARGSVQSINCRVYVEEDGLPTRECTEGSQPAACATPDGRLWFPTTRGLVYVNPSTLKQNPLEPPVIIESVLVDSVRQGTNVFGGSPSEIIVPPGKRTLEIHYASLNLGGADRARFRYRLNEQQNAEWTDDSGNRVASYQKLLPGTYQFQVTACNEDGVWNSNPASLTVIVQPSLWQKGWFRSLLAAGLLAAIAGLVYYFSTQKFKRQVASLRQQEALEHERARIARDLHDQLGANLTQVALLAEMAESDKNLPDEVEDHAKQITQTARETTKALDEIVWAVNPSNDTLEGLVNYSGKYAQEYFALAGLRYRVDIPGELPDVTLPPEVRHNVFLAFKESVNNVVKHAQATEVHIRLRLDPAHFALEIEDDGKGPAGAEQKTGRNGLRNMRKRMEDVGGSFTLGPAPNKGTLVRLTAPIKNRNAH